MTLALADVMAAANRIAGMAVKTPMVPSPFMAGIAGCEFLMKLELCQPTGAFKLRGAANAIAQLPEDAAGVTCCSTGNHGRAVAYAARRRGFRAVICMSTLVPANKVEGIAALGAETHVAGRSQDEAGIESQRLAANDGLVEIPPFDHEAVIAGQGTAALEMLADRPDIATILVPLSGGGLAAGVALAAKAIKPSVRIIGVTMDRGAAMHASIAAGRPVDVEEVASLADSLGGGIGLSNRYSFALCRDLLDDIILVSEDEIYRAMQVLFFEDRMVAEGASVVGLAAVLSGKTGRPNGPVATLITGRNVDMGQFRQVINGEPVDLAGFKTSGGAYGA